MKYSDVDLNTCFISSPIKGMCKSYGIWVETKDKRAIYPLIYFHKPQWIPENKFIEIIKNLNLYLQDIHTQQKG